MIIIIVIWHFECLEMGVCFGHWLFYERPWELSRAFGVATSRQTWGGSNIGDPWETSKMNHNDSFIELDDGKIYRKALYLMGKSMVSCRFSLKPIHWFIFVVFCGKNPPMVLVSLRETSKCQDIDLDIDLINAWVDEGRWALLLVLHLQIHNIEPTP